MYNKKWNLRTKIFKESLLFKIYLLSKILLISPLTNGGRCGGGSRDLKG